MSRLRRQMSYSASLSTMKETSVCSRSECVESTQLYGSTTAVETCGAGAAADGVEGEEALEAGAVVGELADVVEDKVDDLLADGVVAARVVVGRVLLARDELLRVVQLAVGARAHLVHDGGLEVDEHAARDVLARAGLREEGVEGVVAAADGLVGGHLAVGLDAVLEAVELPAGVADLDASLTKVDGDDLTHVCLF